MAEPSDGYPKDRERTLPSYAHKLFDETRIDRPSGRSEAARPERAS